MGLYTKKHNWGTPSCVVYDQRGEWSFQKLLGLMMFNPQKWGKNWIFSWDKQQYVSWVNPRMKHTPNFAILGGKLYGTPSNFGVIFRPPKKGGKICKTKRLSPKEHSFDADPNSFFGFSRTNWWKLQNLKQQSLKTKSFQPKALKHPKT